MLRPVSAKFFEKPTIEVAPGLIGKILEARGVTGRIVEVEAYTTDEASHAVRRTDRSAIMYDTCGHVYVYIIYGMYPCLNFTTEKQGVGAVLIRAVEPQTGIDLMRERRGVHDEHSLCDGPGKLCRAFGITLADNGTVVGDTIKLYHGPAGTIQTTARIGITKALDLPWRFYEAGNPFVSRR
jgi:DNA-3-methyladenine glycosylase